MNVSIKKALSNNNFLKKPYYLTKKTISGIRNKLHFNDSERKLAADNQEYWNQDYDEKPILAQDSHWRNKGIFEDEQRWLSLGKEHLDLIRNQNSSLNLQFPVKQIVEWGCGGGANAFHFAPLTETFIGIDINPDSLTECHKQILESGKDNFFPILINASDPETIVQHQIKVVDLFLCTYVFELFPSPAYGLTILKLANNMLKPGGIAFVHIRYNDGRKELKSKRWGYKIHPYIMTTYTLEEFWEDAKNLGFEPLSIYLTPKQPLVSDKCTAYYFLKKIAEY